MPSATVCDVAELIWGMSACAMLFNDLPAKQNIDPSAVLVLWHTPSNICCRQHAHEIMAHSSAEILSPQDV